MSLALSTLLCLAACGASAPPPDVAARLGALRQEAEVACEQQAWPRVAHLLSRAFALLEPRSAQRAERAHTAWQIGDAYAQAAAANDGGPAARHFAQRAHVWLEEAAVLDPASLDVAHAQGALYATGRHRRFTRASARAAYQRYLQNVEAAGGEAALSEPERARYTQVQAVLDDLDAAEEAEAAQR